MISKEIKKYPKLRRIVKRKKRRQKKIESIFEKFILLVILKKLFTKVFLSGYFEIPSKIFISCRFSKIGQFYTQTKWRN